MGVVMGALPKGEEVKGWGGGEWGVLYRINALNTLRTDICCHLLTLPVVIIDNTCAGFVITLWCCFAFMCCLLAGFCFCLFFCRVVLLSFFLAVIIYHCSPSFIICAIVVLGARLRYGGESHRIGLLTEVYRKNTGEHLYWVERGMSMCLQTHVLQ